MSTPSLYRIDAIKARQTNWLGPIVLLRPVSFSVLAACAGVCASALMLFIACASYTSRSTVSGQLLPDTGLLKIVATQPAIVLQKLVKEGQLVRKGDVLYILSSERQNSNGAIQAAISDNVEQRRLSLRDDSEQTRQLQQKEKAALVGKIGALQAEAAKLDAQIEGQKSRIKLATDTVARYQGLQAQNFISRDAAQQKQEDLLDQRIRLQAIERDRIGVGRELAGQQAELDALAARQHKVMAQIERDISLTGQELTESEAKRRLVVTAPASGVATAVLAEPGQAVDASRPLLNLMPSGAVLEAHLLAPSKAIGFIKPGDAVLLRYQAFPYQQFGHASGTVASVARTALPPAELAAAGAAQGGEPMYAITVRLATQSINAYGQAQPLQAGMLLEADILQEKRRLIEWVLAPLYSITGKL